MDCDLSTEEFYQAQLMLARQRTKRYAKRPKDFIEKMSLERQERIKARTEELLAEELEREFSMNRIHRGTKE